MELDNSTSPIASDIEVTNIPAPPSDIWAYKLPLGETAEDLEHDDDSNRVDRRGYRFGNAGGLNVTDSDYLRILAQHQNIGPNLAAHVMVAVVDRTKESLMSEIKRLPASRNAHRYP